MLGDLTVVSTKYDRVGEAGRVYFRVEGKEVAHQPQPLGMFQALRESILVRQSPAIYLQIGNIDCIILTKSAK